MREKQLNIYLFGYLRINELSKLVIYDFIPQITPVEFYPDIE
jgi:hypothetical protein